MKTEKKRKPNPNRKFETLLPVAMPMPLDGRSMPNVYAMIPSAGLLRFLKWLNVYGWNIVWKSPHPHKKYGNLFVLEHPFFDGELKIFRFDPFLGNKFAYIAGARGRRIVEAYITGDNLYRPVKKREPQKDKVQTDD